MFWIEVIGWIAAVFTLAAYTMKTMLPLRYFAVGANCFFILYGFLADIYPTLVLHILLLPFNVYRLVELLRLNRKVSQARAEDFNLAWLKDLVHPKLVPAGQSLFRRGDSADFFYYVDEGEILLEEIGVTIKNNQVLGEIAFFSKERQRTLSATTKSACRLYPVDEKTLMRLYYQNPAFGFFIVELLVSRLLENISHAADGKTIFTPKRPI